MPDWPALRSSTPPLPPRTRVRRHRSGQYGTVQPYIVSVGQFPVMWDDPGTGAIWELVGADDVTVLLLP